MHNYDFKSLSPYEFEGLCRDILKIRTGYNFKRFKSGKDGGIDLRHIESNTVYVAQCKHYANSKFSNLLIALQAEKSKVHKIKPSAYFVLTSLSLTPSEATAITIMFAPYLLDSNLIWRDELNDLLSENPEIERKHYKLWLQSSLLLTNTLNNDIHNLSESEFGSIEKTARLYVQTEDFPAAVEILKTHKYCIISGVPGIGKTTLAQMLLLNYVRNGYQLIKVSADINEGLKMLLPERKQIFYYDDFLGPNCDLGKNEDDRLVQFIDIVQKQPNKRLIMTTREYLLKRANVLFEKLEHANLKKCLIEPTHYTLFKKALVLYNHLYFADIPDALKRSFLVEKSYMKVVSHPNFNPRLIEYMVQTTALENKEPTKYVHDCLQLLTNPKRIWANAFADKISSAAKTLLKLLYTMPPNTSLTSLEKAFYYYYGGVEIGTSCAQALKELDDSFIRIEQKGPHTVVHFINPSVADFLAHWFAENETECVAFAQKLCFIEQLEQLLSIYASSGPQLKIRESLLKQGTLVGDLLETLVMQNIATVYPIYRSDQFTTHRRNVCDDAQFLVRAIEKIEKVPLKTKIESLLGLLIKESLDRKLQHSLLALLESHGRNKIVQSFSNQIIGMVKDWLGNPESLYDFHIVAKLVRISSSAFDERELDLIAERFRDMVDDEGLDFVKEDRESNIEILRITASALSVDIDDTLSEFDTSYGADDDDDSSNYFPSTNDQEPEQQIDDLFATLEFEPLEK